MDDKDWKMLIALHEEKSITKAASRLFLSQPALTYRLDQLEKEIGAQLFLRSTRGISFTSAGERLVSFAEKMLQEYADIKKYVTAQTGIVSGTLRLATSSVIAHNQLPALLKEFHQKYPAVDICLYTGLSNDMLSKLQKNIVSVAIIRGDHPWDDADILLQTEPLCIVSAEPLSLPDLPGMPGISYHTDPTVNYQIDKWWKENYAIPPNILMKVDSVYTCRQLVLAGLGWSIMPTLRLPEHVDNLFITEIRDKTDALYLRPTRLLYRSAAREIDAANAFIDFICDKFQLQNKAGN